MCGSMNSVGFGGGVDRMPSTNNNSGTSFNSAGNPGVSVPSVDLTRGSAGGSSLDIDS